MKASNLHDLWASPDNSRLTSKQFSFRLPTHIAAKIAALCELYPNKTRTQVVADLLTSALDELEAHLPEALGSQIKGDLEMQLKEDLGERYEIHYELGGLRGKFRNIANRHYRNIEKELGNESPPTLYTSLILTESELNKD